MDKQDKLPHPRYCEKKKTPMRYSVLCVALLASGYVCADPIYLRCKISDEYLITLNEATSAVTLSHKVPSGDVVKVYNGHFTTDVVLFADSDRTVYKISRTDLSYKIKFWGMESEPSGSCTVLKTPKRKF